MNDVFLSYAHEDRSSAFEIAERLERSGLSVWWDRQIGAGQNYHRVTQEAIDEAKCVLVVWSRHSVDSEWVLNEATQGAEKNALIPVLLEQVRIPLAFRSRQAAKWPEESSHAVDSVISFVRPKDRSARSRPKVDSAEDADESHNRLHTNHPSRQFGARDLTPFQKSPFLWSIMVLASFVLIAPVAYFGFYVVDEFKLPKTDLVLSVFMSALVLVWGAILYSLRWLFLRVVKRKSAQNL